MPGRLTADLPRSTSRLSGPVRRLLTLGLLTFGVLLALALPASAHADLLSSSPADGAVLAAEPQQVVLVFSEEVVLGLSSVRVTGPGGQRLDSAPAQDANAESERLTVGLRPDPHPGTYVLDWRATTADDGHTTTGTLTFSVGSPSHPAASGAPVTHDRVTDAVLDAAAWLGFAGLALLVGGTAIRLCHPSSRGTEATEPRSGKRELQGARWPGALGWGVLLAGTVIQLFVYGPATQGYSAAKVFDRALLSTTLDTREGHALVARIILLALVAAVGEAVLRRPWGLAPAVLLTLGLGATWSLVSHASTGAWQSAALVVTTLHVTAMAVWAGGLFGMAVLLARVGSEAGLSTEQRVTAARFTRLALSSVGVLVATGLYQAFREVSGLGELTGTSYGRLLLIKTGLLALILLVAAAGPTGTARTTGNGPRALRRAVLLELVGISALLVVTVVLTSTPPARDAAAPPRTPAVTAP
ncbi:copper resistance protein CopC [Kitasatospora sp. NPDC057223]|uniref:copper resistance CopC/CopD family protein n=1 Tax=Kitasatospora sp. NPDC057223 TaxID=3346055 RepID=UPI003625AF60